jgi:hypothetical protein
MASLQSPQKKILRSSAESVALEIVMRFEEEQYRIPEDRHDQHGIGYDIYSYTNNEKYYIEVKHFSGAGGKITLTPHQWEKAKKEEDKYYIYVVSKLKVGNSPILEIIQNPVKYLLPDPVDKTISNWKNGVIKQIVTSKK